MEVTKTMQPGEAGTRQLLNKYGKKMVCVRYRKDQQLKKRYTTVELIIEERPYKRIPIPVIKVWVNINFKESKLRETVKSSGAKWRPDVKLWEMEDNLAKKLGLKNRIVKRLVDLDV